MAILRDRPYGNYNFLVDVGTGDSASIQAGFSEVVLPDAWVDVLEYRSGNDRESGVRKIPGRVHYGNLVLKRGVIGSLDLYTWWNAVRNGDVSAFRTVVVSLQSEDRAEIVLTWRLLRAWPVRYACSGLDAQGKITLVELLELAFERLEIE
jgi:phage tail-like protein